MLLRSIAVIFKKILQLMIRKLAGFICWQTGFIRWRTDFIFRADEASQPADEASPPTDKDIPIGTYSFSCFSLFSNVFFTIKISIKTAFYENLC